jgi:hypothetical protein
MQERRESLHLELQECTLKQSLPRKFEPAWSLKVKLVPDPEFSALWEAATLIFTVILEVASIVIPVLEMRK